MKIFWEKEMAWPFQIATRDKKKIWPISRRLLGQSVIPNDMSRSACVLRYFKCI
ncbi:MAG: hypothetical protein ABR985_13465 [Methanotrichaceae archaeon]